MCRGVRAFLRDRATPAVALVQAVSVDEKELRAALDEVFDQAVLFHGYADYMRDYDVYIYATADPRTGIAPQHLRYRFTHCVRREDQACPD